MPASIAARGSDEDYCSSYPTEGHHYVSHSVQATPVRWIKICSVCGHISSQAIREQMMDGGDR
jgi:hypothetical protein